MCPYHCVARTEMVILKRTVFCPQFLRNFTLLSQEVIVLSAFLNMRKLLAMAHCRDGSTNALSCSAGFQKGQSLNQTHKNGK